MTTVNSIEDLIRILRDQPEWADQLRSILMTQDLIELPEKFARYITITEDFKDAIVPALETINNRLDLLEHGLGEFKGEVNQRFDNIEHELAEFKTEVNQRFDGIDQRFNGVDQRFNRLEGKVDNGLGTNYEIKVDRNIPSAASQSILHLRSVRVLKGLISGTDREMAQSVENAVDEGRISWNQFESLMQADLIFSGRHRSGGPTVYTAAEASITAGNSGVERALERAGILSAVMEQPALAAVISHNIGEDQQKLADRLGVTIIHMPQ